MRLKKFNFDFMRFGPHWLAFSVLAVLISFGSFFIRGFDLGIDFTGGTLLEITYPEAVNLDEIRQTLAQDGFGDAQVQYFGTDRDVMIRMEPRGAIDSDELSKQILASLKSEGAEPELQRVEFVGPQVGSELAENGVLALVWVAIGILIYIYFRFEWKFAVNSVLALVHDVVVVLGVFSLFQLQFDLNVLAATLAVAGYSLNDTIVIFDRVRENFLKMRKATPREVINTSVNETLSRTIITSGTTLFTVGVLYFFGGDVLEGFALALLIGIVVGTYSTVFVASYLALRMGVSKADLLPPEKEGAEMDRP